MKALKWLLGPYLLAVILAAFFWPQPAKGFIGESSRIVFFHVPMAWTSTLAFVIAAIYSIVHLVRRSPDSDEAAASAVRLGFLYSILATVTGSIFAGVMWNSYWNWDPRETSIVMLLFLYAAYLFLRGAISDPERRGVFCAVYALFSGFVMPFLVFVMPRVATSLHPQTIINPQGKILMDTPTRTVFFASLAGFTALFLWMWDMDRRLERMKRRRKALQ
jgi:ABC-type transport system involved in cytochrome c biogenesis, permease component